MKKNRKEKSWKRWLSIVVCLTMICVGTPFTTLGADIQETTEGKTSESQIQEESSEISDVQNMAETEAGDQASLSSTVPESDETKNEGTGEAVEADEQDEVQNEEPETAKSDGSFVLAASTINENLILPVRVNYSAGDTIWSALEKSSYTFEKDNIDGFVKDIEGVEGNFCIFCSDGEYEMNRSPEHITVIEFTELTEYSQSRIELLKRMVEYQEMTNHVQNFPDAADAFERAVATYKSAEENTAASLLQKLNDAIAEYENILNSEVHTVRVNATQNGEINGNLSLKFTDSYGNIYQAQGDTIELKAGKYRYWISDGGYNYCASNADDWLQVSEDTTLNVTLPSGEWFGDIYLLGNRTDENGKKIPFPYQVDEKNHLVTCYVDDRCGGKDSVYLYITPGKDLPSDLKNYDVRYYLNDTHDLSGDSTSVSWNSEKNDYGVYRISPGMEESQYDVSTRYLGSAAESGSVLLQNYTVKVVKIPTAVITMKDSDGNSILEGFDPSVTEYSADTAEDQITINAVPYQNEGYSIAIQNGTESVNEGKINLKTGENLITVTVSHISGTKKTYQFQINKVAAVETMVQASSGVKVQILNQNNEEVKPIGGKYFLVPETEYVCVASVDDLYYARKTFSVKTDAGNTVTVQAPDPETRHALSEAAFYNASSVKNRLEYEPDQEFAAQVHQYQYRISDANTGVYVQTTPISGYQVKAVWNNQSDGKKAERAVNKTVSSTQTGVVLSHVLEVGGYGNTVTLVAYRESGEVTYYQNYQMNMQRSLHLKSLSASTANGPVRFVDGTGNALNFDRDTNNYYLMIVRNTDQLQVSGTFINENNQHDYDGGYYAWINGQKYTDLSEVSIPLDPEKTEETITIQVCHANREAEENTYQLHVKKRELVNVTFQTVPEDANVFVQNEVDHTTVYPDTEGIYKMMPDVSYTYTVTKSGYRAEQKTGFKVDKDTEVTVMLKKADPNLSIKDLPSEWTSFRDEDNNAVLDEKTPVKAEDSVLYWANKDIFNGYCGHPILVNGYLYTYDSKNLLKLDTVTGELAQRGGALVRPSSFSIQPPTYGGGMIFVGLSQGTIQAFNADTMESLWVYQDPLGGQPNCQITYKDGYIYTGFWNSETNEANYVCISTTDEDLLNQTEEKKATWTHTQKGGYYWAGAYIDASGTFMLEGTDDGEGGYKTGYAHVLSMNPATGEVLDDLTLPHTGDVRSNITHDTQGSNATGDYYFTSKGGYLYRISVGADGKFKKDTLRWIKLENGKNDNSAMSTSTPTIYNGRAYVGVSGNSQFGQYSGHGIAVLDLGTMTMAYYIPTQGYPQTSGILTRGYEQESGKVYVYFFDNFTPGKLRVISDQPGQTAMAEETDESLNGTTYKTGYVLFTPSGAQSQYALCNPIVDEYGTLYFRNDSNYMMALGATISKLEVTRMPDKTTYQEGEVFDPTGMEVTATYANGKTRDVTRYVSYSTEKLTSDDTDFAITFEHVMYQNKDGQAGVDYTAPIAHVSLNILSDPGSGVTVKGTVSSWDGKDNTTVRLYDSSVSDGTIRDDMRKDTPELATDNLVAMGNISTEEDGRYFVQNYQFEKVKPGTYKLAIEKKGKYVVKVVPVTVEQEEVNVEVQQMWLYGDVTGDGVVNTTDATQILRYISKEKSVLTSGREEQISDRKLAANVTAYSQKDASIDTTDVTQILRYISKEKSIFSNMQ